jgi:hypothetical protein
MIRINLLKNASYAAARERRLPVKAIAAVAGVMVFLAICIGGMVLLKPLLARRPAPVVMRAPIKAEGQPPSTFVKSKTVEDVVNDADTKSDVIDTASGYLNLPYNQLSLQEKINFEALFTRMVCEMLVRDVPGSIGLTSLTLSDYRTVSATGIGSSRALVNGMFESLRRERLDFMPPPRSFIRPYAGGFRFEFVCRIKWGLTTIDPFVDMSLSNLPYRESLSATVKEFEKRCRASGVALHGRPELETSDLTGPYPRFVYHINASASFVQFTRLLQSLYDARMQCAFKELSLKAADESQVSIAATIVVATKK